MQGWLPIIWGNRLAATQLLLLVMKGADCILGKIVECGRVDGNLIEDPHILGFLLNIPSTANHTKHHPPSPPIFITPLPTPMWSHLKFKHCLDMWSQVYYHWAILFPLTYSWLCLFIFSLKPFYYFLSSLSFDTFFMTHRTIFLQPDRSCCLVVHDLSYSPDPHLLFFILVHFGPHVITLIFYS